MLAQAATAPLLGEQTILVVGILSEVAGEANPTIHTTHAGVDARAEASSIPNCERVYHCRDY